MTPTTTRLRLAALTAGAVLAITGVSWAAPADAQPNIGCERIPWPDLLNWGKKRSICDSPRRADGSWTRSREIWTPAHRVPYRTSCYGTYSISCTTSGGYDVGNVQHEYTEYVVFDHNVLAGEPGWLPPGTWVLR